VLGKFIEPLINYLKNANVIKKILNVDYPRGRAKRYLPAAGFANFISAKS